MTIRRKVRLSNPALLTWARRSAGYSVDEIAAHLKKEPHVVRAWEHGADAPTLRQLEKFARKVRRSVAALYLPEPPAEPEPPRDYRRLPADQRGEFSPKTRLAFREMRNALADLRDILGALGKLPSFGLPHANLAQSPEDTARAVRHLLGVPVDTQIEWPHGYAALDAWRGSLFDQGVLVEQFSLEVQELRGFSILDGDLAGIGICSKDAPEARAFSVFHEVGHLCLRQPGVSPDLGSIPDTATEPEARVERYCNRFAAAFLLPADAPEVQQAVAGLAGRLDRAVVQRAANRFKVSKYAMALRAVDLGFVDKSLYSDTERVWRDEDSRRTASPGFATPIQKRVGQRGKRYVAAVLEALDRDVLTGHEAASILELSPAQFDEVRLLLT
jgi:Zn-dependent peptidase ImmA (M78 family)/transcriptional regulator with XRE-family HTH domain